MDAFVHSQHVVIRHLICSKLGLGSKERMEQQSAELGRAWGVCSTYIKPKDKQKTVVFVTSNVICTLILVCSLKLA